MARYIIRNLYEKGVESVGTLELDRDEAILSAARRTGHRSDYLASAIDQLGPMAPAVRVPPSAASVSSYTAIRIELAPEDEVA